jgi:16S rRNA (guanine966-N2)-methyltransferase
MRVITGSARGTKLITLESMDLRPTGERVKEAIFSMLQFEIEGRRVLDLFAGSGQLGIESLSRGAEHCTFVDSNSQAVKIIKENLIHAKLFAQATVLSNDFLAFLLHNKNSYDIVFIDPPYSRELAEKALCVVTPLVSPNGVIVVETAKRDPLPQTTGAFELVSCKGYGKANISVYRVPPAVSAEIWSLI